LVGKMPLEPKVTLRARIADTLPVELLGIKQI